MVAQEIIRAPYRVQAAEFERFVDQPEQADRRFELLDGEVIEKMPSELHGAVAARFTICGFLIFLNCFRRTA